MRLWKKLFGVIILASALCVGQTALAQSASLELRAVMAEQHTVAVACSSGGRVTLEDGTSATAAFLIGHNEETALYILPDTGYKIKSVVWNGKEITRQVDQSGRVCVSCLGDTFLDITFERTADAPSTGYGISLTAAGLTAASGLLLGLLVYRNFKNRKRRPDKLHNYC